MEPGPTVHERIATAQRLLESRLDEDLSLDEVARGLTAHGGPVDLATLRQVAEGVTGAPSSVLADDRVPGY